MENFLGMFNTDDKPKQNDADRKSCCLITNCPPDFFIDKDEFGKHLAFFAER
jgi:hypothetical protein